MKSVCVGLLVFLGFVGSCLADIDCNNALTQLEMNECAAMEFEAVDKKLNARYASFRKSLDAEHKNALKEVQKAWVKFRDLSCDFETSGSLGGSIYPMEHSLCLAEKTRARIRELEKLMGCKEGDTACPPRP